MRRFLRWFKSDRLPNLYCDTKRPCDSLSCAFELEQTVNSGSEKVTGWQEEYGGQAREQIKANPLTAVGIAFFAGILFSRIIGR